MLPSTYENRGFSIAERSKLFSIASFTKMEIAVTIILFLGL